MKLAIVTTHPIQYNAPWFRLLAQQPGVEVKVFYTWSQLQQGPKFDPGFGKVIEWDIPLLEGYVYEFVNNVSKDPGTHHFTGIDNPGLVSIIKQWDPAAIIVIGWNFKSHLACMRHFKGKIPVLFRGDSTLLNERPGIKKILRRIFLTYIYSNVDHALYVGTNNKKYFKAHGLKERQLHYAPHAIDNDRFGNDESTLNAQAEAWKQKLGINKNDFTILFAGKLEAKKNPSLIIQLASVLKNEHFKFILVGNGPMEQELKTEGSKDKRIIFIDFQNQQVMPVVYRLGDIFLLPSNGPGETWGLAVNEAMASGKPVIMTDKAGGAIDLITAECGMIVKSGDITAIVHYIDSFQDDKEKLKKAGQASSLQIGKFSFEVIVREIVSLLNRIAHKKA